MIQYDAHRWTSHLFDLRGSMVAEIMGRVSACVIWSGLITVLYEAYPGHLKALEFSALGHTLVGAAIGLLLVFRTNASYDRFWEGRKHWGSIINETRNIARASSVLLRDHPDLQRQIIYWTAAFAWSCLYRLRGEEGIGEVAKELDPQQVHEALYADHTPLYVARRLTDLINEGKNRGAIDTIQQMALDQNVQLLIDYIGACERIRNTPIPYAYAVHLRRVLIAYCFTLPFTLVRDFGWQTVTATFLIAYTLFGIEEIGVEIEDPFGVDPNDLALEDYCRAIERNIRDLLPAEPEGVGV